MVTITDEEFQKYCKDKNLNFNKLENNENQLFESIQKNGVLILDDSFPFQYEFQSSFDGCGDDYNIIYDDGTEVEENIVDEIYSIIEEGDFYDLEDEHGHEVDETKYEIYGDLDIEIN